MADPESKASGFNSAVQTLRKMVAVDAFERMTEKLPPETAQVIRHPPLPLEWIPTVHFKRLVEAAQHDLFAGADGPVGEWGRQAVKHDLRTIYRVFIRFLSPQYVIERSARLWNTYQRNSGEVRAERDGDGAALVRYEGLPSTFAVPAFWAYQRGVLRGVVEATGLKEVDVAIVDGAGHTGHARIRVSWR